MNIADYPPQEPLSALGQKYHDEVMRRQPAGNSRAARGIDVRYGTDPYQGLLVFPAPKPNGRVLLFFHGGGWTGGYKEWMAFMAPAFTAAGVTFISAGYRLAPAHLFATSFADCCSAVACAVQEAAKVGGDAQQLFIGGHSAGGHYAALMAVRSDWQDALGLSADVIKGCLPVSGVYRFDAQSGMPMRPRFLGPADAADAAAIAREASPLFAIDGSRSGALNNGTAAPPPFFITTGANDFPHLIKQADEMRDALQARGGAVKSAVKSLVLEGCDHFQASYACGDADGLWVSAALAWMSACS